MAGKSKNKTTEKTEVVYEEVMGNTVEESYDMVNHPKHYNRTSLEVIDGWEGLLTHAEYVGALKSNIIKYICRYQSKNGLEDLKKAKFYLEALISDEEKRGHKDI